MQSQHARLRVALRVSQDSRQQCRLRQFVMAFWLQDILRFQQASR